MARHRLTLTNLFTLHTLCASFPLVTLPFLVVECQHNYYFSRAFSYAILHARAKISKHPKRSSPNRPRASPTLANRTTSSVSRIRTPASKRQWCVTAYTIAQIIRTNLTVRRYSRLPHCRRHKQRQRQQQHHCHRQ